MWLKQFFVEEPIDFEKRCKTRIVVGLVLALLGLLTVLMVIMIEKLPILYLEPQNMDLISGFYIGAGGGLMGAGIITAIKNNRYLNDPELKKKRSISETDERNRMLGLRTWAYAGYSMFLFLYIGMLAAGFISPTVLKVLLVVGAVYGLLLLVFRTILQKCM